MNEFKIRFSIVNTVFLSILGLINLALLIICYFEIPWDNFRTIDLIGLIIGITLMFGGGLVYCLYMITKYTATLIIIGEKGIERRPLLGKSKLFEWNKVISINEQRISDYLQGSGPGYVFKIVDNNKNLEIRLFKDKKTIEMIEQLKSSSIVESTKFINIGTNN